MVKPQQADPTVRFAWSQMRNSAAALRSRDATKLLVMSSSPMLLHTSAAVPSLRFTLSDLIVLCLPLDIQSRAESNDSIWTVTPGSVVVVVT